MGNNDYVKIIPCLDMKNGRVVKGVNFTGFKDAGDPVEIAQYYDKEGADEIVLLDISATTEDRETTLEVLKKITESKLVKAPLVIGGGIRTIEDFERAFAAGASKCSINSAAIANPYIVREAAEKFGSDKIVVAIDGKLKDNKYIVCTKGGFCETDVDAIEWAKEAEELGAGEILLTSFDCDGTKNGFDLEMTKAIAESVSIPVTASGGAGKLEDFYDAVVIAKAKGLLAASLFHFRELTVGEVKEYLKARGVNVAL